MFSQVPNVQIVSGICWNIQNIESSRYRHRLVDSLELFELFKLFIYFYIEIGLLDLSLRGTNQGWSNVARDVVDGQIVVVSVGLYRLLVN